MQGKPTADVFTAHHGCCCSAAEQARRRSEVGRSAIISKRCNSTRNPLHAPMLENYSVPLSPALGLPWLCVPSRALRLAASRNCGAPCNAMQIPCIPSPTVFLVSAAGLCVNFVTFRLRIAPHRRSLLFLRIHTVPEHTGLDARFLDSLLRQINHRRYSWYGIRPDPRALTMRKSSTGSRRSSIASSERGDPGSHLRAMQAKARRR